MKLRNYILLGAAGFALGVSAPFTQSKAEASTYRSIPSSLRGYYISSNNLAMIVRKHTVIIAIPRADASSAHVNKVIHAGHIYRIHTSINMGNTIHVTYKLDHYAHNKFKYAGKSFHKVSKSKYYYYVSH